MRVLQSKVNTKTMEMLISLILTADTCRTLVSFRSYFHRVTLFSCLCGLSFILIHRS